MSLGTRDGGGGTSGGATGVCIDGFDADGRVDGW
jgi:hypothetical protein